MLAFSQPRMQCLFEICYSFLHSDIFVGMKILGGGGLVIKRDKTQGEEKGICE